MQNLRNSLVSQIKNAELAIGFIDAMARSQQENEQLNTRVAALQKSVGDLAAKARAELAAKKAPSDSVEEEKNDTE